MSKAVVDSSTKQIKGVILIDIKLDAIKEIIENSKPGTAGFVHGGMKCCSRGSLG